MTTFILDGIWGGHRRWEPLRRRLEKRFGDCHIWTYDNSGKTSLETLGTALSKDLESLEAPFHLVGYSMGGLIVREAMRQAPHLPLEKAAFLHTPHEGSLGGWLFPLPACREMRPGSKFLKRLNRAAWKHPTLATWCPSDLVVLPGKSGCWPSASQILRSDMPAHAWPVISPGIHRAVADFLSN